MLLTIKQAKNQWQGAYRRWKYLLLIPGAMGPLHAATTQVIVEPGASGIVGTIMTTTMSVQSPALTSSANSRNDALGALSMSTTSCNTTSDINVAKGSTGVYGFRLVAKSGNTRTAAVLLPTGGVIGRASRRFIGESTGIMLINIRYLSGVWSTSWDEFPFNGVYQQSGNVNGTSPYASTRIMCPNTPHTRKFDITAIRSVILTNPQFDIDFPKGGLSPGVYKPSATINYLELTGDATGNVVIPVLQPNDVDVIVAMYSCALSVDSASLNLNPDSNPTASTTLKVACASEGPMPNNAVVWLSAKASGVSSSIDTGSSQKLGVKGSSALTIRGRWSDSAPGSSCSDSDAKTAMHFDGRDGYNVGTVTPTKTLGINQPVTFRLCRSAKVNAGDYIAQATFSIIQR